MGNPTKVRRIVGLQWARACAKPSFIPTSRPRRAANKAGLEFECRVSSQLPGRAVSGQWFEFCDANGPGWCQTDILWFGGGAVPVILECKLTWTLTALEQLHLLYIPVVSKAFGALAPGLVVCKNLTAKSPPACHTLSEALSLPGCGTWHLPYPEAPARPSLLATAIKSLHRKLGVPSHV